VPQAKGDAKLFLYLNYMTYHNNYYNKNLQLKARKLRSESVSKAEKRLWKRLLSRRQTGQRFLRQRPINEYIVDFFAPNIGLIIEIDGSSHLNSGRYDKQRQSHLEGLGYTFLRFSEAMVLKDLEEVQARISHSIYSLTTEANS
jgi:very-short-patch-repair endonuclease